MRRIVKEAETAPAAVLPLEEDMEAVNRLSRRPLTPEEVYLFAVRLCDNQTDRDDEYFDRRALEKLAELFVGKTGIFDHNWSAREQTARLYRTQVVDEPGTITEAGEAGCWLKGWAYMLRTPETEPLIAQIEGGILKEVSVSCAVSRSVCSVCGNDINDRSLCSHVRGRLYEGKRCIVRLEDPTDAYEWSFVAVPAQPQAGVVKALGKGETLDQLLDRVGRDGPWREELRTLEKQAEAGRSYLAALREDTVRLGLLAEEGLEGDTLRSIAAKLEGEELEALRRAFSKRLEKDLALPVQLGYGQGEDGPRREDLSFTI